MLAIRSARRHQRRGRFRRHKRQRLVESAQLDRFVGRRRGCDERQLESVALCALVALLSINPIANLLSPRQRMNSGFDPLELVNSYGAFGSVSQVRHEVVIEGARLPAPGAAPEWREYEFPCKPGDVLRAPCWVTPYHYRLDWQMWFAGLSRAERQPWIFNLIYKLLTGDEPVDVQQYRSKNPAFPHDGTGDQFYDEAQWESYRRLGQHSAAVLVSLDIGGQHGSFVDKLFHLARQQLVTVDASLDGAYLELPLPRHADPTPEQAAENAATLLRAWRGHAKAVLHSLETGFHQGWDLHPNQLVSRYVATVAFYRRDAENTARRLAALLGSASQAVHTQGAFDDAASGRGLNLG